MKVKVHRDQAVWEREYLEVEIPDGTPVDEQMDAIHEALDKGNFTEYAEHGILGAVESISTEVEIVKQ